MLTNDRVFFVLLPERESGVATDPTGMFAERYKADAAALFHAAFGFAALRKDDPLLLDIVLFAPRPSDLGFAGWKYEGWLVDQPSGAVFSSATSANPSFGGVPHPTLDASEYPITTGLFRDAGDTLRGSLGVFTNTFRLDQSAWPYDLVVVSFEPPETGLDEVNFYPLPDPVRPVTGPIPGRLFAEAVSSV